MADRNKTMFFCVCTFQQHGWTPVAALYGLAKVSFRLLVLASSIRTRQAEKLLHQQKKKGSNNLRIHNAISLFCCSTSEGQAQRSNRPWYKIRSCALHVAMRWVLRTVLGAKKKQAAQLNDTRNNTSSSGEERSAMKQPPFHLSSKFSRHTKPSDAMIYAEFSSPCCKTCPLMIDDTPTHTTISWVDKCRHRRMRQRHTTPRGCESGVREAPYMFQVIANKM